MEPYDIKKVKELTEKLTELLKPEMKKYTFPELVTATYSAILALLWQSMEQSLTKDPT